MFDEPFLLCEEQGGINHVMSLALRSFAGWLVVFDWKVTFWWNPLFCSAVLYGEAA